MKELITRRSLLASMAACGCCLAGLPGAHGSEKAHSKDMLGHTPHWSYEGDGAPEKWGELSADFRSCQLGTEQTPINLDGGIKAQFDSPFSLDYAAVGGDVINNGHTIQVNIDPGCVCTIDGTAYTLAQFHFHHPSEHLLSGKSSEMELHLVHKAENGGLAVIGVFLRAGERNADLAPVFDAMPAVGQPGHRLAAFNPGGLLPRKRGYYRYMGSLTTPPCSEGLTWTVFKEPVELSREQINAFAALFPNNARPVQKRNRRFILDSTS
jgi:carbonic anhydrase